MKKYIKSSTNVERYEGWLAAAEKELENLYKCTRLSEVKGFANKRHNLFLSNSEIQTIVDCDDFEKAMRLYKRYLRKEILEIEDELEKAYEIRGQYMIDTRAARSHIKDALDALNLEYHTTNYKESNRSSDENIEVVCDSDSYDLMHDIKDELMSRGFESDMAPFSPSRGSSWSTLNLRFGECRVNVGGLRNSENILIEFKGER